jgi:hypothetical protein
VEVVSTPVAVVVVVVIVEEDLLPGACPVYN